MIIIGKEQIFKFIKKYPQSRIPMKMWLDVTGEAVWTKPVDIRNRFRSVDFLSENRAIFNIGGNSFRLVVIVTYEQGVVRIDWVGTHAEYDKKNF